MYTEHYLFSILVTFKDYLTSYLKKRNWVKVKYVPDKYTHLRHEHSEIDIYIPDFIIDRIVIFFGTGDEVQWAFSLDPSYGYKKMRKKVMREYKTYQLNAISKTYL